MKFTQYYLDCLSHASYLVGDETTGQAVIVDPRRDVQEYLTDAASADLQIVGVINTHFHADFAAGHLELAEAAGAWIGMGESATAEFDFRKLGDGETISLGEVTLQVLHTPGHTPESISVVIREHAADDVPYGVLTGDTLFIGDVGRPDLMALAGTSPAELAGQLYDSVHHKLLALADDVRLFPAHGAGSSCGKNLSTELQCTIGNQRKDNYACQPMSREEFIQVVTEGQQPPPQYFAYDAQWNKKQRDTWKPGQVQQLDGQQFLRHRSAGVKVLDARDPETFLANHLVGSLNVPSDGRTAETIGMVFCHDDPLIIVAPDGEGADVAVRAARIGFDNVVGYVDSWGEIAQEAADQIGTAARINPEDVPKIDPAFTQFVDVRGVGECADGMLPGAINIPLPQLRARLGEIPRDKPLVVNCAGGWRSSVASSVLRAEGFTDVRDLRGGYGAWQDSLSAT